MWSKTTRASPNFMPSPTTFRKTDYCYFYYSCSSSSSLASQVARRSIGVSNSG
jgi:hypothetical protein